MVASVLLDVVMGWFSRGWLISTDREWEEASFCFVVGYGTILWSAFILVWKHLQAQHRKFLLCFFIQRTSLKNDRSGSIAWPATQSPLPFKLAPPTFRFIFGILQAALSDLNPHVGDGGTQRSNDSLFASSPRLLSFSPSWRESSQHR